MTVGEAAARLGEAKTWVREMGRVGGGRLECFLFFFKGVTVDFAKSISAGMRLHI